MRADYAAKLDAIAIEFGVSRERVRQIQETGLRKLRKLHGEELGDGELPTDWPGFASGCRWNRAIIAPDHGRHEADE